jgi:hypothetical protein
VLRLTEGRLELCLCSLGFALSHTHLPASQLEGWSYSELNPNCLYADTKTKNNNFDVALNFVTRNIFSVYFLIEKTVVYFLTLPFP